MVKTKGKKHGGARLGAGPKRKFSDDDPVSLRLGDGQLAGLVDAVEKGLYENVSDAIRWAIEKAFGLPANKRGGL